MDIKRILKYQEHGDDGLFIEGMHQQEIPKVNEYFRLYVIKIEALWNLLSLNVLEYS